MSSTERNWALDLNSYGRFKSFKYRKIREKNAMIKVRKTFYHQLIAIGRNLARKTKQRKKNYKAPPENIPVVLSHTRTMV